MGTKERLAMLIGTEVHVACLYMAVTGKLEKLGNRHYRVHQQNYFLCFFKEDDVKSIEKNTIYLK